VDDHNNGTVGHVDLRVLAKICVPFLIAIDNNFPDKMTCAEVLRSIRVRSVFDSC